MDMPPDDIGPMIASLLSEENRWVNAQRIEVSGGMSHLIASGRILKGSWTVCGSAPLCFSFFTCLGKCTSYTLCIEVFAVNRSSGLLTPGLIQGASIDPVESEFIDKLQDDGFGRGVVARYRKRDSPRRAFGLAQLQQVFSIDVVERLNHRTVQLLRNPAALC